LILGPAGKKYFAIDPLSSQITCLFKRGQKFQEKNHLASFAKVKSKSLGGDSQNFLHKFLRFFVILGLKILRLFRFKVLFEDIIKG
jgi:hypothetical protein